MLFALGRRGFVGQKLDQWFGLTLPFTTAGAIVAATFVSLPFFVLAIEASKKIRYLDFIVKIGRQSSCKASLTWLTIFETRNKRVYNVQRSGNVDIVYSLTFRIFQVV